MLTISGSKRRFCDGISRRDFLTVGMLGGALSLADVLRLRSLGASLGGASPKAVIMVCLNGGPSHLDMYDLKPDAPAEIRGEFQPIATNVPGFDLSELMPLQASIADRLAVVRNVQWPMDDGHRLHLVFTGFPESAGRPSFGSVISRLKGDHRNPLPPYVSMAQFQPHPILRGHEEPSYVGTPHRPFVPYPAGALIAGQINYTGPGAGEVKNLALTDGVTRDQLADRKSLLSLFDRLRRDVDASGELEGNDAFTRRALEMISSNRVRDAFDLSREPPALHERYGGDIQCPNDPDRRRCWEGSKFLLARRLVEAGVPVVTLAVGVWDTHSDHFTYQRDYVPRLDQSIHALVTDLHERGLDQDVAVVVCGEMGRTPRINANAGRDHWPLAGFALFAGGGLRTGQVVGATDAHGERPVGTPFTPQNILATLYHVLGIDPSITFPDFAGRPRHILDDRQRITELL
ncbi:DUF1501 domain-containing protein [bacterium]|nr:DUF1501 domain-containing protein [bacterium]